MSDDSDIKMNKAERLAIAGAVAPYVREGAEKNRQRRVALVDKDGNVTGYTTLADAQKAILERAKIEIAVVEGNRPEKTICTVCGCVMRTCPQDRLYLCSKCKAPPCEACGKKLSKSTVYRALKDICAARCGDCRVSRNLSKLVEKRRELAAAVTHCPKGHPYSEENTALRASGKRSCRTCARDRSAARRAANRRRDA